MSELTPRTNLELFGHEVEEAQLMQGLESDKLAHGWLITGPRGIGKATLAYRFARTLLSGKAPADMTSEDPVFLRVLAGSHSDLLVVEPLFDVKKDEFAKDITVDQARQVSQFLSLTAGEGRWRVVIVDSVDDLNTSGANAILKILEEPPQNVVLLLISHNPSRLLPTIRSRCRQLKVKPLDKATFGKVMRLLPTAKDADTATLGELTHYSPGLALQLHEQGAVELYRKMTQLLQGLPRLDHQKLQSFADGIGSGQVHANWRLFTRLSLSLFERVARYASGGMVAPVMESESAMFNAMAPLHPAPVWAAKWQEIADQFMVAERLHLDYKPFVIIFFHSIASHDEFKMGSAA